MHVSQVILRILEVLVPSEFMTGESRGWQWRCHRRSHSALLPLSLEVLLKCSLPIVLTVLRVPVGFTVFTAWSESASGVYCVYCLVWTSCWGLLTPSSLGSQLRVSRGWHTPSTHEVCFFQRWMKCFPHRLDLLAWWHLNNKKALFKSELWGKHLL